MYCCLLKALKTSVSEGETCESAVQHQTEEVLKHTGREGQQELRRLMKTIRDNWTEAVDELSEVVASLDARLQRWTELDRCCVELSAWLTETEVQLKNIDMKSTVADKQAVVTQLCVRFLLYFVCAMFIVTR